MKRESVFLGVGLGTLLVFWIALSWSIADSGVKSETQEVIDAQAIALKELTDKTAQSIDQGIDYLHEIPALVAKDEKVLNVLSQASYAAAANSSVGDRRSIWSNDPQLSRIDSYLFDVSRALKADTLWILNSSGDCVASSNVQTPDSFVGTNYADRDYFRQAQEGKRGQQYAIGRKTNTPGLYFSAQIILNGKFLGVAVAKIDLQKLEHFVSQADSFVTDSYGVVIMARDPTLEMHSLPDAAINGISASERISRYKRTDFPLLKIDPWDSQRFPTLQRFSDEAQPVLISKYDLRHESLVIYALKRIPSAAGFSYDRLQRFWVVSISGSTVIMIIAGVLFFALIRKRAAYLAAHSESLLRAAIESTADGILVINNIGQVSTYNKRFANICDLPLRPETRASSGDILIPFMDRIENSELFQNRIANLQNNPQADSFDSYALKDGTQIECHSHPQRLNGNIVGRVWSFRDVTQQRLAESQLLASRNNLETLVLERTAELQSANADLLVQKNQQDDLIRQLAEAHQQLLQTEKLASIGQLAAGMAHEINTPIGFSKSNLKTIEKYMMDLMDLVKTYEKYEAQLDAESGVKISDFKRNMDYSFLKEDAASVFVESINGLQRVSQIVQDLKDFSHMGDHDWCWSNLEQGLESTIRVIWSDINSKAMVVREYGAIPEIECIPSQINHVFMNLLLNAAQAIEAQGQITIRTGCDDERVYVEISDTGIGIPIDKLKRIFDPFFTTKPVGQGVGLGLSIAYGIVESHKGQIEVQSKAGTGSTFRIWLPKNR
jgi:PAS domain S-box-containing protein